MATLTTSWASYATSQYQNSAGNKVTMYLEARYSSQSTTNNTSTIYTRLRSAVVGNNLAGSGYQFDCTYCDTLKGSGVWTFANEVIISSDAKTITHNTDGTKSISLSARWINKYHKIDKSMSTTVDLPKIDRLATVVSATDFNDETNPTITFNNPAGFTIKPYINFYDKNNNLVHDLERNTSISTPYTWEITSEERDELRQILKNQTSYRAQIGVLTYNGNTQLGWNSVARTMTFVNATPTQTTTFTERNQKLIQLFGSSSAETLVQNVSDLKLETTPSFLKYATIGRINYTNGDVSAYDIQPPHDWELTPTSGNFTVEIVDSRGFSSTTSYTKNFINYEPVNILRVDFKRYAPTSSDVILNAEIRYIQETFGSTPNVPTIKWKKGEEGVLNTLTAQDYTIDTQNNKIIISNLRLANAIPYTDEARFTLYVEDLLTEHSNNASVVTKGIPTFEAGENDFQVNGDLYIADTDRENAINVKDELFNNQKILWQGSHYMTASETATLLENVSAQKNGIILVWSAFDTPNNTPYNYEWKFTTVPKFWVSMHEGTGVMETFTTGGFGYVGAKYVYIYNDRIVGNNSNSIADTDSGIVFQNNRWVLRYVIGY